MRRFRGTIFAVVLSILGVQEARANLNNPDVVAVVNTYSQTMTVLVEGQITYTWPVSTGKPRHETPPGIYTPQMLSRDHYSSLYNWAPMPWAVFYDGDYAVHGTEEVEYLGQRRSHGCVRLDPVHAEILFRLVEYHGLEDTRIVIQ